MILTMIVQSNNLLFLNNMSSGGSRVVSLVSIETPFLLRYNSLPLRRPLARSCIRASVDALYRDGANVRGDAHMLKASMLRECENMSLLRHLVKLYKAY